MIERLIDLAADLYGFDPVELRRRNFIPPDAFPYTNGVGITYDNGEYENGMDAALALRGLAGLCRARARNRARAACCAASASPITSRARAAPRASAPRSRSGADGRVELVLGTMNSGQGHETSFAQLLTEWLGVPFASVDFVAHDTDRVAAGGGSHSGRSMRIASLAIGIASDKIIEKGKKIAAHLMEVDPIDVDFEQGRVRHQGHRPPHRNFRGGARRRPRATTCPMNCAASSTASATIPCRSAPIPRARISARSRSIPIPGSCSILRWTGVDDVGRAVNPLILHGQTHGAAAQGIGQALLENVPLRSRRAAQLLSASFMDYAVPRADFLPSFDCELIEVPATSHKYGIRPGGEGGTTPALGAAINAVVDALSELGVRHVEMPATPERVWRAISEAAGAFSGEVGSVARKASDRTQKMRPNQ